jgi:hypothetical protein
VRINDVVDLHIGGIDLDGVRGNGDDIRSRSDGQDDGFNVLLVDVQLDAGGTEALEAVQLDGNGVGADGKLGEQVSTILEGVGGELDAGLRIGGCDQGSGDDRVGRIRYGALNAAVGVCGVGGAK